MRTVLAIFILAAAALTSAPAFAQDNEVEGYDVEIDRNNPALADDSSRDLVFGAGIGVNLGEH